MPLLLAPAADRETAGLALALGLGSRDDPVGLGGAAVVLGRLILSAPLEGGPTLGELVERLGGTADVTTGPESLTMHARVPSEDAPEVASWMLDALTQPALTGAALDLHRPVAADPAEVERAALVNAVFPGHPLGAAVCWNPDSVERLSLDPLRRLHRWALAAVPLALAYVGDVREAALRKRVSPLAMARVGGVRSRRSSPAGQPNRSDSPGLPDGTGPLLAAAPAPSMTDPRRHAFAVLGHLLDVTNGHALAYAYGDLGVWGFRTAADGPAAIRALRAELGQLSLHGPAPVDLAAAVRRARGPDQDNVDHAIGLANHHCVTGAVRCPETEAVRLAEVTAADVAAAAAAVADGLVVSHVDHVL
jgi:hypothetical protein